MWHCHIDHPKSQYRCLTYEEVVVGGVLGKEGAAAFCIYLQTHSYMSTLPPLDTELLASIVGATDTTTTTLCSLVNDPTAAKLRYPATNSRTFQQS